MSIIPPGKTIDSLPVAESEVDLNQFLQRVMRRLPSMHLRVVRKLVECTIPA